jgi:hypothetical protein
MSQQFEVSNVRLEKRSGSKSRFHDFENDLQGSRLIGNNQ